MSRRVKRLALLVGSNPMPNYLAAKVLRPTEVILISTPETQEPSDRLRADFERNGIGVSSVSIIDATDVREIRDAFHSLAMDHLHYSGGTKPMAAHARLVCQLGESQASYLDERKGLLRFDDSYDIRLDEYDLGLTLDLLLELHGVKWVAPSGNGAGAPTDDDVVVMAKGAFGNPDLVDRVRQQLRPDDRRRSITQAKSAPWKPEQDGISLSVSVVPGDEWTNARYEIWDDFLTGGWLETWTAGLIRTVVDGSSSTVDAGVHCKRARPSPTEFEIDVALIRGHRLHVVSCTTHRKKALCKSKLFEVAMRARQMGGDLARSALVSLLDGSDPQGRPYVEHLRADIASIWDAPNVPRVFGLADLREWRGTTGASNLNSLKEWLDS